MNTINFSEKKSFQVTINKAHKILATLQKIENQKKSDLDFEGTKYDKEKSINTIEVPMATIITGSKEDFVKLLEVKFNKKIEKIMVALEHLEDIKDLKETIFNFNVSSGVSQKLSFIEKNKYLVNLYETMIKIPCEFGDISIEEKIKNLSSKLTLLSNKEFDNNEIIELALNYWDTSKIEKDLKSLKSKISIYEDEIMASNASNTISINLYENTASFLGLE